MMHHLLRHAAILFFFSTVSALGGETEDALAQARQANVDKDYTSAVAIYQRLAQDGSPEGMMALGLMHVLGTGVERNPARACDMYQQAAEKGLAMAQHLLGDCFYHGVGRPQDYGLSKGWYEKALKAGDIKANCALGNQYMRGQGVMLDLEHGMALCRNAADHGDADAQADLASAYLAQTSPQAHAQAFELLTKAVSQGHPNAALILGKMYWNGDGTEKDKAEAARLFLVSWRGNHAPEAPFILGEYYFPQSLDAESHQVKRGPGVQTMYWLSIAYKVDPVPENRAKSLQYAQLLNGIDPSLNVTLNEWLKKSTEPPPLSW